MNENSATCSIIIVNYNTEELLINCIKSIYTEKSQKYHASVYVVDNASMDRSVQRVIESFPDVVILPLDTNLGFSKANNIAIQQADSKYLLLLNPDTVIIDNCIEVMLDYMENEQNVGAVGCQVLLPDGKLDKACKRGLPTPLNSLFYFLGLPKLFPGIKTFGGYHLTHLDEHEVNEVDSLVGAFMLIRKKALDEIGLLDEDFFMFGEDIDLCYRLKKAGWKVVYNPHAKIIHYKGAASGIKNYNHHVINRKRSWKVIYEFHRAMIVFYQKHFKKRYNVLIRALVYCGIGSKLVYEMIKNTYKQ